MIKYLGSKRALLPTLLDAVGSVRGARTVADLFSGTARVGHALKRAGYRVLSNDHNAYAATSARCYVQADREDVETDARRLIAELDALPGVAGYFTQTYCLDARYFRPENGARIDAIREGIARKGLAPELEAVLLVALMEAADRVDSTAGVQMAFLKRWSRRSGRTLRLRCPDILPRAPHGKGAAFALDATEAAQRLEADVAYLDPPYNRHSYLGNYHLWETLILGDRPATYGVAKKRVDCRERRSAFNSKLRAAEALERTLRATSAPTVVVSHSDEGFLDGASIEAMLLRLWDGAARVYVVERAHPRYMGARIGIYSPSGVKVGRVGRLVNVERLYVATRVEIDEARLGARAIPPCGPERPAPSAAGEAGLEVAEREQRVERRGAVEVERA
ncbi:MAG TPA: DNA adenine methylase [Planctomycetota bacterium]|nr:DNA adenine methylase [Planctomycetota bacterium]